MWSCDVLTFPPHFHSETTCSLGAPSPFSGGASSWYSCCLVGRAPNKEDENTRSNSNSREMEVNTTRNRMVQKGIYTWHKYSCLVLICLILGSVKTYSIDIDIVLCFSPLFSIDSLVQWSFFVSGVFCRYRRFLSRSCCQCRHCLFFSSEDPHTRLNTRLLDINFP